MYEFINFMFTTGRITEKQVRAFAMQGRITATEAQTIIDGGAAE